MTLEEWKTIAEICEAASTVVALCIGGVWTYLVFVQKREKYPRAKVVHRISVLGQARERQIVRATVQINNLGNVLISLSRGEVMFQQISPLLPEWDAAMAEGRPLERTRELEFHWPLIEAFNLDWRDGFYIVEPKESEEFNFDFCVADSVACVQIYSYFKDESQRKREIGWSATTTHTIIRR